MVLSLVSTTSLLILKSLTVLTQSKWNALFLSVQSVLSVKIPSYFFAQFLLKLSFSLPVLFTSLAASLCSTSKYLDFWSVKDLSRVYTVSWDHLWHTGYSNLEEKLRICVHISAQLQCQNSLQISTNKVKSVQRCRDFFNIYTVQYITIRLIWAPVFTNTFCGYCGSTLVSVCPSLASQKQALKFREQVRRKMFELFNLLLNCYRLMFSLLYVIRTKLHLVCSALCPLASSGSLWPFFFFKSLKMVVQLD